MTRDALRERDLIKRKKSVPISAEADRELILRRRIIEDKDAEIAKVLWNYLSAVRDRWPSGWNDMTRDMSLARSTGFAALMRVLPPRQFVMRGW